MVVVVVMWEDVEQVQFLVGEPFCDISLNQGGLGKVANRPVWPTGR